MGPVGVAPGAIEPPTRLYLAIDETTNELHCVELTTNAVSEDHMVKPLVAHIPYPVPGLDGDGAYDYVKVYDGLESCEIELMILPRSNTVIWTDKVRNELGHARHEAIAQIEWLDLAKWKYQISYHRCSEAETGVFRWKTTFGERLLYRLLANQQAKSRVKASC